MKNSAFFAILEFCRLVLATSAWGIRLPNASITLTGDHSPPRLTPRPLLFTLKNAAPGQLFSAKLWPRGQKNETKSPPRP